MRQQSAFAASDVTVIVVTYSRPDCVQRCLAALYALIERPGQMIVVDASRDNLTKDICLNFPDVQYIRNENGCGHMTESRNIGLKAATGKIVAFVDDDAFAEPDWLVNLLTGYADTTIGGVGGRALNGQPNEESIGVNEIGKLTKTGVLAGYFAADCGKIIDVDHIIGCNMSFRREILAQLGGFREDFPGISGLCEDTDMCFRVKQLKYRLVFVPSARVFHIGAPQPKGKRFDLKWNYYYSRNYTCLLLRNFGPLSAMIFAHILASTGRASIKFAGKVAMALAKFTVHVVGLIVGIFAGLRLLLICGFTPIRNDSKGKEIRAALSRTEDTRVTKVLVDSQTR